MRRKDREMTEEFAREVVEKCEWTVLGMVDTEGMPYTVPVSAVLEEEWMYFHSAMQGKKIDALKQHPQVCMSCVGNTRLVPEKYTTEYESAVIRGTAEEVMDEAEKIHAMRLICEKYAASNLEAFDQAIARSLKGTVVWKVRIQEISGKGKKVQK